MSCIPETGVQGSRQCLFKLRKSWWTDDLSQMDIHAGSSSLRTVLDRSARSCCWTSQHPKPPATWKQTLCCLKKKVPHLLPSFIFSFSFFFPSFLLSFLPYWSASHLGLYLALITMSLFSVFHIMTATLLLSLSPSFLLSWHRLLPERSGCMWVWKRFFSWAQAIGYMVISVVYQNLG